jgi:hypothetical protein
LVRLSLSPLVGAGHGAGWAKDQDIDGDGLLTQEEIAAFFANMVKQGFKHLTVRACTVTSHLCSLMNAFGAVAWFCMSFAFEDRDDWSVCDLGVHAST